MKKNEPIRIAQIIGKWVGGGVEAVVMNYYRHIDHSKIQFDFICDDDSTNIPYEEIEKLGGKVILIPPYQKVFKYHKELKRVLKEGNYKIVHSHINALSVFSLWAAWSAGVPIRIAHSHSTTNKAEWKKNMLKQVLKPFSKVFANTYFACTEHAGRWLFGNRTFNKGLVTVINNGIDVDSYIFNEKIRKEKRKELKLKDTDIVIGHIGRFMKQKNHDFLIDIFNELYKENNNYKLMLIGQGPLQEEIKQKVKDLKIENAVMFLGQKSDANKYYQAMDLFLFPSLYEGLGMVFVEAQAAALPSVASTEVPKIAEVSDRAYFISLDQPIEEWANKIKKVISQDRTVDIQRIRSAGYDITTEVKKLEDFYFNNINKEQIELFGLPGCGKSTYYKNNISNIKNLNENIHNKPRIIRNTKKIIYSILLFVKYHDTYKKSISVIKKFNFSSNKTKIKMKLYLNSILYLIQTFKNCEYVLEEGLLQVLWAFCYNSKYSDQSIEFYYATLNNFISNKIIHVKVDDNVLIDRLMSRNSGGGSELEHDIKNDKTKLDIANDIENKIILKLKNKLDLEVIEL